MLCAGNRPQCIECNQSVGSVLSSSVGDVTASGGDAAAAAVSADGFVSTVVMDKRGRNKQT